MTTAFAPKRIDVDTVTYRVRLSCICGEGILVESTSRIDDVACVRYFGVGCGRVYRRIDTLDNMVRPPTERLGDWTCAPKIVPIRRECDTCGRTMTLVPGSQTSECSRCDGQ